MCGEDAEIGQPELGRTLDGARNEWGSGFETDAYEHDLLVGVSLRKRKCVERRVDNLDVASSGLLGKKA